MDQFRNHPLNQKYNIDSAVNSLWGFYKDNFLVLFLTSFVMSLITQYISSLLNINDLQNVTDPKEIIEKVKEFILPMIYLSLISLVFSVFIHYYVIYNPVDNKNNIIVSAIRSMRYFFPYLITIILLAFAGSIAIALGIFLFIIGAFFALIYVMTLYLIILPTMMIEGPDIGSTIKNTIRLVHRGFWSNLGWVSLFFIFLLVISVILSSIILLPFSGSFLKVLTNPGNAENMIELGKNPLYMILSAMGNSLTFPLLPIFATILYFNGKATEEDIQTTIQGEPEDDIEKKVRVEDLYSKPLPENNPGNPDK